MLTAIQTPTATATATRQPSPEALNRREFSAKAMAELMSFSKTQKTVTRLLKETDIRSLESKHVYLNRVGRILASKILVERIMTEKEKQRYISDGCKCTPSAYLTIVRRGVTCSPEKWEVYSKP